MAYLRDQASLESVYPFKNWFSGLSKPNATVADLAVWEDFRKEGGDLSFRFGGNRGLLDVKLRKVGKGCDRVDAVLPSACYRLELNSQGVQLGTIPRKNSKGLERELVPAVAGNMDGEYLEVVPSSRQVVNVP